MNGWDRYCKECTSSITARPFVSRALSTEQRRGRRNKGVYGRGVRQRRLSPLTVAQSDRYLGACASEWPMRCPLSREPRGDKFEQALRNEGERRPGVYQPAPTSEGSSSLVLLRKLPRLASLSLKHAPLLLHTIRIPKLCARLEM